MERQRIAGDEEEGCRVEGVLRATLRVSQVVGLAPVRFVSSRATTVMFINRPWYIYGNILTMTLNCIQFYHIVDILQKKWHIFLKNGFLNFFILLLKFTMISFLVSFCVGNGINKIKLFKSIIHRIRKIKADIGALNNEASKTWQAWFPITFIATNFLLNIVYNIWMLPEGFPSYRFLSYIVESYLMMVLYLQFIIIAFYINSALEAVNEKLTDMITLMRNDNMKNNCQMLQRVQAPIYSINIAIDTLGMVKQSLAEKNIIIRLKMADRLRLLCQAFVLTCNILKEYNTYMNFIFIMFNSIFIIQFSFQLYNVMKYLQIRGLNTAQYLHIIVIFIRLIFSVFESMLFVEPFHRSKVEIAGMRLTVCRIMCHVSSAEPMLDELDVFFKQLLLNDFSYTASGLFALERNLTYTIIGVVATVLALFQQFLNTDEN